MPSSMRCFKSFFKHTWHPQQMVVIPSPASIWDYPCLDQVASMMNLVYDVGPNPCQDFFPPKTRIPQTHMDCSTRFDATKAERHTREGETELGEVKLSLPTSSVATTTPAQPGNIPCKNGGCKTTWRSRPNSRPESPWHVLKTIFLISVIVALIVWVIVYTLLAQYQVL